MTGSLSYTSIDEFDRDYKDAIYAEIADMVSQRKWWKQSILMVEDPRRPDLLTGQNDILHRYIVNADGQQKNIPYRDDVLMGIVDYLAIVDMLNYLSKAHEFGWNLGYPAEPREKLIGTIDNGEIDPRIFEFPLHEMEALEITDEDIENETLHKEIRAKHFER